MLVASGTTKTFTWVLPKTAQNLTKNNFTLRIVKPDNSVTTVAGSSLTTFTAPTSTTNGSITYSYATSTSGLYKFELVNSADVNPDIYSVNYVQVVSSDTTASFYVNY